MKLGIGAVSFGPKVQINLELIRRAEALGFDSAWTAEAYGNDAVTHRDVGAREHHDGSRSAPRSCRCPRARRRWRR